MAERLVGRVEALWRYPVKSMLGERLEQVAVTEKGVCGDRAYALWDHGTARVASAKNPRLWRELLGFQAQFLHPPEPTAPLPPVAITRLASTAEAPLLSSDPAVGGTLSQLLGRTVTLLDQPPEHASLDQFWPEVPQQAHRDEVTEQRLPPGTFFDACSIHALTTATLARLRQLEPQLDFAVERFRPNLLIEPLEGAEGFVEEGWIGRTLRLGGSLELRVDRGCPRCVITTLAQGDWPEDIEILRATARHNQVVAGIRLSVLNPGPLAVGDPVTLLE